MAQEFQYFIMIVSVLLVPKVLMRYRIPSGITAMIMGILTSFFLGWFDSSQTIGILASLGITSLFLFAGLEIEFDELRKNGHVLMKHITKSAAVITLCTLVLKWTLNLPYPPSIVLALGLTTPSTGFILNSLNRFDFNDSQRYWIRSKAIAKEVLALIILFFTLQSDSLGSLTMSLGAITVMIISLPFVFKFFLKKIAPFAPDSEVTFMVLLAFVCGVVTLKLGTYYLIGAFIVGVVAGQFRHFMDTDDSEKMLYSISFFSRLLIPFYFFKAGLTMNLDSFNWMSLLYGFIFLLTFVPLRYLNVFLSIHLFLRECWDSRYQISLSLLPTLIFGLVIASILRDRFQVSPEIVNGLILYTILSSIIPAVFLKSAPPEEYDAGFVSRRAKDLEHSGVFEMPESRKSSS